MESTVMDSGIGQRSRAERMTSILTRLTALGAILASIGGVVLHISGTAAQRGYLRAFSVDPDAFPRSADWILLNGYFSILDLASIIVVNMLTPIGLVVLIAMTGIVAIYRWKPKSDGPPQLLLRLAALMPGWLKQFLFNVSVAYLAQAVIFITVAVAVLVAIVPWATGESYGVRAAKEDIARYKKGCHAVQCSELWRGTQKMADGWIVASSPTHLAFYDAARSTVRLIERQGVEILSPVLQEDSPTEPQK